MRKVSGMKALLLRIQNLYSGRMFYQKVNEA